VSATALRKFWATRIDFVLLIRYLIFDFQFFSVKTFFFLLMYEYLEDDSL
jgi:hypothetical protein